MDVLGRLSSVLRVRTDLADDRLGQTEKNSVRANSREISACRPKCLVGTTSTRAKQATIRSAVLLEGEEFKQAMPFKFLRHIGTPSRGCL